MTSSSLTSKSPAAPETSANPETVPCPRCAGPLTDPNGLGWCMKCGYCQAVEGEKLSFMSAAEAQKVSLGGLVEVGQVVGGFPRWFWIAGLGVLLFFFFSFLPAVQLPEDSFDRALWTTV